MALGAWLMRPTSDAVLVWRATADLPAGAPPRAEAVSFRLGSVVNAYLRADRPLVGRMLIGVPAGSLIPAAAVGVLAATPVRKVTVPVNPQHAPIDISPGMRVDVWGTPTESAGSNALPVPVLVLPRALVDAVGSSPNGMSADLSVVLDVPPDQTQLVLSAARSGTIDLVLVPLESP